MALRVALLLLAASVTIFSLQPVCAEIRNEIHTDNATGSAYSGSVLHVISEAERPTFHLADAELKNYVKNHSGVQPANVFVRSPTPWGDLYASYQWPQVKVHFFPISIEIFNSSTASTTLASSACENNFSDTTIECQVSIQQTLSNSVTHTRSSTDEFSIDQEINYTFFFEEGLIGGRTTFGYKGSWTSTQTETQEVKIDTTGAVTYPLKPGRKAIARLVAKQGILVARIRYNATVDGTVAVNYPDSYRGHHFWAFDVNNLLAAGKKPLQVSTEEIIKVGFFSEIDIEVSDVLTGALIPIHSMYPLINKNKTDTDSS